jgi:hypothetical protein
MKPTRTIYIKHSGSLTAKKVFEMISENTSRTEEYEQSKKKRNENNHKINDYLVGYSKRIPQS